MWSSWRRFSAWMAAQSSGSFLARVLSLENMGGVRRRGKNAILSPGPSALCRTFLPAGSRQLRSGTPFPPIVIKLQRSARPVRSLRQPTIKARLREGESSDARPPQLSAMVDNLNERIGRAMIWLILIVVVVSAGNAVSRFSLNMSSNAMLEVQWYLFSAVFLLSAGYVLKRNEHIRIDIIAAGSRTARRTGSTSSASSSSCCRWR